MPSLTTFLPRGLCLALALLCGCTAPPAREGEKAQQGALSLTVDNDSYNFDDGNYTNGVAVGWVSPELKLYPETSKRRRIGEGFAELIGDSDRTEAHVAFTGGQLIFTPEFLLDLNPPAGARPYAGILFFDTALFAREPNHLTSLTLRLGLVGNASMAEEFQKELHEWFGADRPRGWSHQLNDEPIVNLGLARYERVGAVSIGLSELDLTLNAAAAGGTFLTGLSAGAELRIGGTLPRDIGGRSMRTGFETTPLTYRPSETEVQAYGFLGLQGYSLARYLPIDGGVFKEGRSAELEQDVVTGSLGISLGQGPIALLFSYTFLSDTFAAQEKPGQYGTISLTWHR